jgi:hypothetical protein
VSTLQTTNLKNPSSGSNNIVLSADGSVTVGTITGTSVRGGIISGTAVASTSGTSIDFTGIPSWVKRVTVMFNGVSTNGASVWLVQLGAGSVQTTGYVSYPIYVNAGALSNVAGSTAGVVIASTAAANTAYGAISFALLGSNIWVANGNFTLTSNTSVIASGGVTLSSTLDRVRITTVNGTDAFDAGSINILYEG